MKRLWAIVMLWLALAGHAQATGWTVITPQSCTGASAPALCCLTGNAADNSTACNVTTTFGHFKVVMATFNPDGTNYSGGNANYSLGGDTVTAAQFRRLGLDSIITTSCDVTTTKGYLPVLVGRRSLKIHLINPLTGAETGSGVAIAAGVSAATPGEQFDCLIVGY